MSGAAITDARVLSIRQPWIWAILHAGKAVENRDWQGCYYRGPILLHASKTCTRREYADAVDAILAMREDVGAPPLAVPPLDELPRGGLVGAARILDASRHPIVGVEAVEGVDGRVRRLDWARGHLGFRVAGALGLTLGGVRELPFTPVRGELGLFHLWLSGLPNEAEYAQALAEVRRAR